MCTYAARWRLWMDMNSAMELRRATWVAALRLAIVVSTAAAVAAMLLSSFGDVSQALVVVSVIVVGFALSWVQTGRILADRRNRTHRVTAVHLRRTAV